MREPQATNGNLAMIDPERLKKMEEELDRLRRENEVLLDAVSVAKEYVKHDRVTGRAWLDPNPYAEFFGRSMKALAALEGQETGEGDNGLEIRGAENEQR